MKLKLIDLRKEFTSLRGNVAAVSDISIQMEDREFFVLLGPSGCGKSTLLNLIAGLERPTAGEIWFDHRLVASGERKISLSPRDRNVAMVFQSYALYPHLTVFENVAFPLRIMKESKSSIQESVSRVASMLGIETLLSARPGELSGGQRQRVAIARALVRQPAVFLLDEPLSNLDARLRASTREELKKLQRSLGITTVYVTHDQVEAMSLGDRVALLREGRIEQLGPADDLYERPANTFVAQFVGSPPMNLLRARIVQEEGTVRITIGDASFPLPLPESTAKRLMGKPRTVECLLGVRPEHVTVVSARTDRSLSGRINSVELLGREILLHVLAGAEEISTLTTDRRFTEAQPGDPVHVELDFGRAHLFEVRGRQESLL